MQVIRNNLSGRDLQSQKKLQKLWESKKDDVLDYLYASSCATHENGMPVVFLENYQNKALAKFPGNNAAAATEEAEEAAETAASEKAITATWKTHSNVCSKKAKAIQNALNNLEKGKKNRKDFGVELEKRKKEFEDLEKMREAGLGIWSKCNGPQKSCWYFSVERNS